MRIFVLILLASSLAGAGHRLISGKTGKEDWPADKIKRYALVDLIALTATLIWVANLR